MVLVLGGHQQDFVVPFWVIFSCASVIAVGTVLGGWHIVRRVGFGIYKVRPLHAVDAQNHLGGCDLWRLTSGRTGVDDPCVEFVDHGHRGVRTTKGSPLGKSQGALQQLGDHNPGGSSHGHCNLFAGMGNHGYRLVRVAAPRSREPASASGGL